MVLLVCSSLMALESCQWINGTMLINSLLPRHPSPKVLRVALQEKYNVAHQEVVLPLMRRQQIVQRGR